MKTDNFKQDAIDVIESLLNTIDWLGGDAYEVEAAGNMTKNAVAFLEKHKEKKTEISANPKLIHMTGTFGIYTKLDGTGRVEACNKRVAAKYLGVGKNKVKCIKIP